MQTSNKSWTLSVLWRYGVAVQGRWQDGYVSSYSKQVHSSPQSHCVHLMDFELRILNVFVCHGRSDGTGHPHVLSIIFVKIFGVTAMHFGCVRGVCNISNIAHYILKSHCFLQGSSCLLLCLQCCCCSQVCNQCAGLEAVLKCLQSVWGR